MHRFVHGRLNRSATPPPTTSRKISQPRRSSKRFPTIAIVSSHRQYDILDGMLFSVGMGFRQHDHLDARRPPKQTSFVEEKTSQRNILRPETMIEGNDANEETPSSQSHFSTQDANAANDLMPHEDVPTTSCFRRDNSTEAFDQDARTIRRQQSSTTHQSPGATRPVND
ncbi:MAG: hypothetical protein H8E66_12230 [Planctomycetes bacterium]|nr:hypothetical protein [Planctomycetota bacterium]